MDGAERTPLLTNINVTLTNNTKIDRMLAS